MASNSANLFNTNFFNSSTGAAPASAKFPFADTKKIIQLLYDNIQEYFLMVDKDFKIQMFNHSTFIKIREALGIEIVRGKTNFLEIVTLDRKKIIADVFRDVFNGVTRETYPAIQTKCGEVQFLHNVFSPVKDETGEIIAVMISSEDITEKKKEEELLKEKEERWRFALEGSNLGIWDWNLQTDEMCFSSSYKKLYGFAAHEMQDKKEEWYSRIHPDDLPMINETIKEHGSMKGTKETTYRLKNKDGQYRWIVSKGMIVSRDADGKPLRMIGTHTDITNQKLAEKDLEESNERFKYASRATFDIIWDWDFETEKIYWSENYQIKFGWSLPPDNISDSSLCYERFHPEDHDRVSASIENAMNNPQCFRWQDEFRYKKADGTYAHIADRGYIIRNEAGKALRMIGAMQDVSENKTKELELIKSDERYKYVSRATSDAIWDWDLKTNVLDWGEGLFKLFGYQPEEVTIDNWKNYLHDNDREITYRSVQHAIEHWKKKHWRGEYRFRHKNGDYHFIFSRGYIIRDENGEAIRMIGVMQDITETKKREQELLKSNERFDIVTRATNDLIWDWNLETGAFYRDKQGIHRVYGVADEENIATIDKWLLRIHPNDHKHLQTTINEILNAPKQNAFEAEYRFRRDDGHYVYIHDRGILIRDAEGKPVRMIGAAQDISDRKMLEQELLTRELNKQKLISQATIETQENERAEIGKELHDNVNQVLTTTKLYLDLSVSHPELKDELIQKSSKNIIYVINEIRQLSRSLMNPSLGDLGLVDAINDLIENIHLTKKLQVKLEAKLDLEQLLSENQKLMIFRIIQEALNNVLRHAKANCVSIILKQNHKLIELQIKDDGIGFDTSGIKKGTGLMNIQNRVYLVNGTLKIQSRHKKGATISITFPAKN